MQLFLAYSPNIVLSSRHMDPCLSEPLAGLDCFLAAAIVRKGGRNFPRLPTGYSYMVPIHRHTHA